MKCPSYGDDNPDGQKFCSEHGAPLAQAHTQPPDLVSTATSREHRQVTVLFSELSGYTAMTEQVDSAEVCDAGKVEDNRS